MTEEQRPYPTPLRESFGARVVDPEGLRGSVTEFDGEIRYDYQRTMVYVRLDRDVAGQDLYWYDEDQLKVCR